MDGRVPWITLACQMSESAEIPELYCVHCGYNLHGIESTRCPECGQEFDRAAASTSRIPWMHRREIGRAKAWWRTVWLATFKTSVLASSVAAPVPYADAQRFWLINVVLVLLPVSTLYFLGTAQLADLPIHPAYQVQSPGPFDLLAPWLIGMRAIVVRLTVPILCVPAILGLQTYWMGRCGPSRKLQDRAAAIGLYASGVWIGSPIFASAVGIVVLGLLTAAAQDIDMRFGVSIGFAVFIVLILPCITIVRLTQRLGRPAGFVSLFLATLSLVWWVLVCALCGFVYPWCAGLAWLMLKSI